MLTFELVRSIDKLLGALRSSTVFLDALAKLASKTPEIRGWLHKFATNVDAQRKEATNNMQAIFDSLNAITSTWRPSELFQSFSLVRSALNEVGSEFELGDEFVKDLLSEVSDFMAAYDSFINKQTPSNAVGVIYHAWDLNLRLRTVMATLGRVRGVLEAEPELGVDDDVLRIELPSDPDLNDIATKLRALSDLYRLIAELLFENVLPPQVRRIEAGSTYIEAVGAAVILTPLAMLLRLWVMDWYKRNTYSGQFQSAKESVAILAYLSKVSKEVKGRGGDTKESDENIAKTLNGITAALSTLVGDSETVTINSQRIERPVLLEEHSNGQRKLPSSRRKAIAPPNGPDAEPPKSE